jgi:glycosyltransferase involved in cell wall biosynthesis
MVHIHASPDPAISVVIPAHNEEGRIGRAVASVLADAQPPIEVLVVLDRCTDGTARVLEAMADTRVRFFPNASWPGIGGALNTGLRAARAPLVARIDADDVQRPGRLARQLRQLTDDDLDLCCGWAELIRAGAPPLMQTTPLGSDDIRHALRRSNVIVHSTVVMRRDRVLELGGYHDTQWEDYDLWVRLAADGARFGCVPAVLVRRELRVDGYGERGRSMAGRLATIQLRLRAARIPSPFGGASGWRQ